MKLQVIQSKKGYFIAPEYSIGMMNGIPCEREYLWNIFTFHNISQPLGFGAVIFNVSLVDENILVEYWYECFCICYNTLSALSHETIRFTPYLF